jgi:CBS domain-containing protein
MKQEPVMLIRDLMTRNVESTTPTTTLTEAARRMRDRNIGCLPVNDTDGFIGMLTEKDLTTRATAEGLNPSTTTVRQIMTSGITYCQESDSIEDALRTMEDKHIHHLPVRLSGSNKVVGIVSLSDLALKGPQELYSNISRLAFQSASFSRAGTPPPIH